MHEWERIRSLPSKEKLEKAWRILEEEVWSEKESVWEINSHGQIKRDQRNERRIAIEKYIEPSVMLNSWGIGRYRGRCRGSGLRQLRYREGIEQQRVRFKNRSSIDPAGVKELSRRQELSRSIHQVSRRCRDCVKKNAWEAWQIARYWGGVETAFQNSFSRCEKHRYEYNPTYNSTNDPINTKISQNSLSIQKIFWAQGSPKHTHTHMLNKSNQFYISKISHDSFVSIHYHM